MNGFSLTEQFGIELSKEVSGLFQQLSDCFLPVSVSVILLTAAGSWFIYTIRSKKSKFLDRRTTPLLLHRIMMAVMILLTILYANRLDRPEALGLFIVSVVVMLAAQIGLLTRQGFGICAEICFFWLALPIRELPTVFAFRSDLSHIGEFSAPAQAGIYAAANYSVTKLIVFELIAAALTMLMIGYYARRNYLFSGFVSKHFSGIVKCPSCRIPLVFKGDYCPCCGQDIRPFPRSVMTREPVIVDKHCRICGGALNKGFCSHCASPDEAAAHLIDKVKENYADQYKSTIKGFVTFAAVAVVVFLPLLISDPGAVMTGGSAKASNAFAECFNELYSDNTLAKNDAWLQTFDSAAKDLYQTDKKAFTVDPSKLNYNGLYMYIGYTEAAYNQMLTIEQIHDAVHSGSFDRLDSLGHYFNETNDAMRRAVSGSLLLSLNSSGNIFRSAENIITDSLRYYLSFVSMTVLWIIFLSAAVLLFLTTLIIRRKTEKTELFISVEYAEDYGDSEPVERKKYLRGRAFEAAVVAVSLIVLFSAIGIELLANANKEKDFSEAFTDLYISKGTALELWLGETKDQAQLSDSDVKTADQLIDAMQEDAQILVSSDADSIDNQTLEWNIAANSEDLSSALNTLRESVDRGDVPGQDITRQITELIRKGMEYNQEVIIKQTCDSIMNMYD